MNSFQQIRELFGLLPKKYSLQFWGVAFAAMVNAAFEFATVVSVGFFAVSISEPNKISSLTWVASLAELYPYLKQEAVLVLASSAGVTTLVILKNLFNFLLTWFVHRFAGTVQGQVGSILFHGLVSLPYQWHLRNNPSKLSLAFHNRISIGQGAIVPFLQLLADLLMVVFLLTGFVIMRPGLAFVVLAGVGVLGGIVFLVLKSRIDKVAQEVLALQIKTHGLAHRAFVGMKDLRTSGQEGTFVGWIRHYVMRHANRFSFQVFLTRLPVGVLEILGFVVLTGMVYYLFFIGTADRGEATAILALLAAAAWRVLPAVGRSMSSLAGLRGCAPEVGMVLDLLKESESYPHENFFEESGEPVDFEKSFTFDGVSFTYDGADEPALKGIDLSIAKGEMVGIVGPSGAGKSTFIDILIGLLTPSDGSVSVDGVPLTLDRRLNWVRSIGYVAQDPYMFDGSLAENIAFGQLDDEIDRERVLECCRLAEVQDFMDRLPDGLDTIVGERGVRISGGQRQRLAIARALYHNPQLLLFDEATSALDQRSERLIQETILAFKGQKTLIVVAHNLSTVERCDRIFWIDKGGIRMVGSPEEVLPVYKKNLSDETTSAQCE